MNLEDINKETENYYDSIKDGVGLRHIVSFDNSFDGLDALLKELKEKSFYEEPEIPEEDDIDTLMRKKIEERRALERNGKKKVKW